MLPPFVHEVPSSRVVFGVGSIAHVDDELERLDCRRAMLISSPSQASWASRLLAEGPDRFAVHLTEVAMHVPVALVESAVAAAADAAVDGIVALGGGSSIGLAKAVALRTGLPILAVPSTYSGSEMTPIWGVTRAGRKETGRDARVLPRTVVYDPLLTLDLPVSISAASGMNAVAHLVEGLYSPTLSPLTAIQAAEGLRALAAALPRIVTAPDDLAARAEALYGSWLAGWTLATTTMGIHHRICHVLGGTYGLPHADTHAVVLPHVAAFNADAAPAAMETVVRGLGAGGHRVTDAPSGLWDFGAAIGAPASLRALGLDPHHLDDAAAAVMVEPAPANPRRIGVDDVRDLLRAAWLGARPSSGRRSGA